MKKYFLIAALIVSSLLGFVHQSSAQQTVNSAQDSLKQAYAPLQEFLQITPSNSTTYSPPLRACIVEGAGDLQIMPLKNAASVTLTVVVGQTVPVMITKVMTGTTAVVVCGR